MPPWSDGETRYTYNDDGQLTQLRRPGGELVSVGYDPTSGRVTALALPRGIVSYGYDPITGYLTQIGAPGGIGLALGYDGALPTTATLSGPVAGQVTRGYDSALRLSQVAVQGGASADYRYDDADEVLTQAGALVLSRAPSNGLVTQATLGSLVTTWDQPDAHGQPTRWRTVRIDPATGLSTVLHETILTRDRLGRIIGRLEVAADPLGGATSGAASYAYDPVGRLVTVGRDGPTASYTYDDGQPGNSNRTRLAVTNRADFTGSYDQQDRLTRWTDGAGADLTYTYSSAGDRQTRTKNGQTTSSTYDPLGNLTQVTLPDGRVIDYLIDGANRRVGKRVNGGLERGWLYDGGRLVAELDGAGQVVATFVWGSHPTVPDYLVRGGVTYRLITDERGSVRLVVNAADGAIAQRLDYDEFGVVLRDSSPGFQPFGYAGGLYDRDTGLVRFGARDYDAEVGRFTSQDPLGFGGGDTNLYGYALADPINLADADGQLPFLVVLAGAWAVVEVGLTLADVIATVQTLADR